MTSVSQRPPKVWGQIPVEEHLVGEATFSAGHKQPRKGFVPSGTLSGQVSWKLPLEGEVEAGGGAGTVERKGWSPGG